MVVGVWVEKKTFNMEERCVACCYEGRRFKYNAYTSHLLYIRTGTSKLAKELLKYVNDYSLSHKDTCLFADLDSNLFSARCFNHCSNTMHKHY
jgi:hypothetical protein